MFSPSSTSSWTDVDLDNFLFLVHEIFLYTIAILIRHERFEAVNSLLSDGYYLGDLADYRSSPVEDFVIFRHHIKSLAIRNQRLQLRRLSLHADLLEQRSRSSGVSFKELMQADFVLYLRGALNALRKKTQQWWPETLIFAERLSIHLKYLLVHNRIDISKGCGRCLGLRTRTKWMICFQRFVKGCYICLAGNSIHSPRMYLVARTNCVAALSL